MRSNVIISGTGRCGTTFLMLIFTFLGLDTGFNSENYLHNIDETANSGLEKDLNFAYIVKSPAYLQCINDVVMETDIDWMIIPVRDYEDAALSRYKLGSGVRGGLWDATNATDQMYMYWRIMAKYIKKMVKYQIPTIFLDFDRMIISQRYTYDKLKPVLGDVTFANFKIAYTKATLHQRKKSSLFKRIEEQDTFVSKTKIADEIIDNLPDSNNTDIIDQALAVADAAVEEPPLPSPDEI